MPDVHVFIDVEERSIGQRDGEQTFERPTRVRLLDDGRVLLGNDGQDRNAFSLDELTRAVKMLKDHQHDTDVAARHPDARHGGEPRRPRR